MPAILSDDEDEDVPHVRGIEGSNAQIAVINDMEEDEDRALPIPSRSDKGKSRAIVSDDDEADGEDGAGSLSRPAIFDDEDMDAADGGRESKGRRIGHDFNVSSSTSLNTSASPTRAPVGRAVPKQPGTNATPLPAPEPSTSSVQSKPNGASVNGKPQQSKRHIAKMFDGSDEEEEEDDDDIGYGAPKPKDPNKAKRKRANDAGYAWEASYNRSWDAVQEDESGGLQKAVEGLLARGRRRRAQISQSSLRRSIIRHMYVLLDLSGSMREKDMRPSRFDLTIQYLKSFVIEWFDQNPLGQLGVIGLRDGLAEMIVEMGGNPQQIVATLSDKRQLEPSGEPSLQNGLDMARGSMSHLPSTSSLEVLALFSSLTTTDPGSIHKTLAKLVEARVKVTIIALAAELKICRVITERTGGRFGVAMNEAHYRELIWESIQAPPTTVLGTAGLKSAIDHAARRAEGKKTKAPPCDLMMMGFPTRLPLASPLSLCACHGQLRRGGYLCPRCGSKICEVPTDCEVCGLMVVSSPHLARSPEEEKENVAASCHGCDVPFPESTAEDLGVSHVEDGVSPTGRYRCSECRHDFCMECDFFIHDVLHTCPGCAGR